MNDEIKAKAEQLALDMTRQIDQARQELAEEMLAKGYSPLSYAIEDNLQEFIDSGNVGYWCRAIFKPRFERATTNGETN